ncbi:DUF4932 domain-containing protein [Winogradskyella sp.]|uniref:DUF4932 domain-containing protein n=1 Tax=Winogradskyella sp. TaxID=1883156 RepID=UPI002615A1B6|nr:DUF4932 domain-containing protein [Winogradskyella sp.]
MRITIILLIIILPTQVFSQNNKITINTNKNIEFLGYIIEQGDPMGNEKSHPISVIINKYPENKNSETLLKLFNLASDINYSTLTYLMYFLPELPLAKDYSVSLELASYLGFNSETEKKNLNQMVSELNNYYHESNFDTIWNELRPYRKNITSILHENRPESKVFDQMEMFYQYKYDHYSIQPIITLWPCGFGIRDLENKRAVFVMGPLNINYDFTDQEAYINLAIHEFGHSFVNHVVLKNENLLNKTKKLFAPIKEDMTRQGYSDWKTCIIEHFVRAGEVIIRDLMGDKKQSEALLKSYTEDKKYIFLPSIVQSLKAYRLDKNLSYEAAVTASLSDLSEEMKIENE